MKNLLRIGVSAAIVVLITTTFTSTINAQAVVLHDVRGYYIPCGGEIIGVTYDTHLTVAVNGGGILQVKFEDIDTTCLTDKENGADVEERFPVRFRLEPGGTVYFTEPALRRILPSGKVIYTARISPGTVPMD